jgi:hypothetical protein
MDTSEYLKHPTQEQATRGEPPGSFSSTIITTNPQIAKTARLAIETAARVDVTYDENNGNVLSQVRMEFRYVCTAEPVRDCHDSMQPHEPGVTYVCDTKRYVPCEPVPQG